MPSSARAERVISVRNPRTFWASLLILIGALLLLNNLGLLPFDLGAAFWPLVLVLVGLWFLLGSIGGRRGLPTESVSMPLQGAARADLRLRFGAGQLRLSGGGPAAQLFAGTFTGGLDQRSRLSGDRLDAELRIPQSGWMGIVTPRSWSGGLAWTMALNEGVPIELDVESGASDMQLDLARLQVKRIRLQTGASALDITLPAQAGHVDVSIESGAASVAVHVPQGVAGRIRARGGLSDIQVDTARFPRDGDRYQTPGFEGAANRVDIDVQTGVGSVKVN
jgi:hypothetical protein